jgi:hypothetical protein
MGVNPQDVPVTREDVFQWLSEYNGQIKDTKKLRDYLAKKLQEKDLAPDATVNTTAMDSLDDETSVVDMIMLDLESYAGSLDNS